MTADREPIQESATHDTNRRVTSQDGDHPAAGRANGAAGRFRRAIGPQACPS